MSLEEQDRSLLHLRALEDDKAVPTIRYMMCCVLSEKHVLLNSNITNQSINNWQSLVPEGIAKGT